jgi:hypothetical protein
VVEQRTVPIQSRSIRYEFTHGEVRPTKTPRLGQFARGPGALSSKPGSVVRPNLSGVGAEQHVWCTGLPAPDPGKAHFCAIYQSSGVFHLSSDVQNIIELLGPREVIGRAIAVLMEREDLTRDVAFAQLVRESSRQRLTLRDVAAAIVGLQPD